MAWVFIRAYDPLSLNDDSDETHIIKLLFHSTVLLNEVASGGFFTNDGLLQIIQLPNNPPRFNPEFIPYSLKDVT